MTTASTEVVIVGAGVMGASVAYHLARRGQRNVVLLDAAPGPGGGSTSRATGGYRAQYATAVNVKLSLLSREKLLAFREETGVDPGYAKVGYLWLASTAEQLETLLDAQRVQHANGLPEAREVSLDEIRALNPALSLADVVGGVFGPTDGTIRPLAILDGYLSAARRLGVNVSWGTRVTGLSRAADGRVEAVETSKGRITAGSVVNAAGPWAAAVSAFAGEELPVLPLRRQVALTEPFDALPESMPMTIFAGDGFHLRVRDGRVLLLWPTPGVPGRPFDTPVDDEWIERVAWFAHRRLPVLRDARIDRAGSWAGLYEISPDKHAILGPSPGCPNLYLVNGSSGHGVMHAPALGHLLSEVICDGHAWTLPVRELRPTRFAEGELNPTSELL